MKTFKEFVSEESKEEYQRKKHGEWKNQPRERLPKMTDKQKIINTHIKRINDTLDKVRISGEKISDKHYEKLLSHINVLKSL